MNMRRSRVLIQNEKIRKLFWIGEEKDGSLYIGSYLKTKQYKMGSFLKLPQNNIHVNYADGETFEFDRESKIKISFHS